MKKVFTQDTGERFKQTCPKCNVIFTPSNDNDVYCKECRKCSHIHLHMGICVQCGHDTQGE